MACRPWLQSLIAASPAALLLLLLLPLLLVLMNLLDHLLEGNLARSALLSRDPLGFVRRIHAAQIRRPYDDLAALVVGA